MASRQLGEGAGGECKKVDKVDVPGTKEKGFGKVFDEMKGTNFSPCRYKADLEHGAIIPIPSHARF